MIFLNKTNSLSASHLGKPKSKTEWSPETTEHLEQLEGLGNRMWAGKQTKP